MDLYVNTELKFEKLGMEVRLSEDPNDWPQQVLDELYRQAPYVSDFAPRVVLPTVDGDRRYGLGQVELTNKQAINPRDDSTPEVLKGGRKANIPVIVQDGRLKPLDVLISDGKVELLTIERLRRAMFRPHLFEAIRERPGDMSMIEQLYPPHRQYGGARGPLMADIGSVGAQKEGSAKPEYLMQAILPGVRAQDVDSMVAELEKDAALGNAAAGNHSLLSFVESLMRVTPGTVKVASGLEPKRSVVQLVKLADGFRIKIANPDSLAQPAQADVSRPEAAQAMGPEMVNAAEQNGQATVAGPEAAQQPDVAQAMPFAPVQEFGKYRITAQPDNMALSVWVFPHVMDWDGQELPAMVFSDGEYSGMQEAIVGSPVETTDQLPNEPPVGEGSFYFHTETGPVALVPVDVEGSMDMGGALAFKCTSTMGEQFIVRKVPGLQTVSQIDATTFGIPAEAGFIPFGETVEAMGAADDASKVAQARAVPHAVRVITDGTCYTFQGQPVDKLAGVMGSSFLPRDEAVFLGAVLGQGPVRFEADLKSMRKHGSSELWFAASPVTLHKEPLAKHASSVQLLCESIRQGVPHALLKEAAAIDDPIAVDKILSLGFVSPENIAVFASYIPEIETVIRRLSELLVAVRLGLHSIDEGAVQKALVHLDKVVAGLKTVDSDLQA